MKMVIDNHLAEWLNMGGKRGEKRAFGRLDISTIIIIGNDFVRILTIYVPSKLSVKKMSAHYLFSLSEPQVIYQIYQPYVVTFILQYFHFYVSYNLKYLYMD